VEASNTGSVVSDVLTGTITINPYTPNTPPAITGITLPT
jgi:hypothetical protein